jgi:hypothetical protein
MEMRIANDDSLGLSAISGIVLVGNRNLLSCVPA